MHLQTRVLYAETVHGIFQSAKSQTKEIQSWEESAVFGDYYSFIKYIITSCFKTENVKLKQYTGINLFFCSGQRQMGLETSSQYERLLTTWTMSPSFTVTLQHNGGYLQSNAIYKKFCKGYWCFRISDQTMDWTCWL